MSAPRVWWKYGVFYQIYPRSFMDSNGDGVGDLQGIIDRLDYIVELGVDAIWISPIFPSPMADFGYDVSDYVGIHPMFGDLETFDRLIDAAHTRNLSVVLDYVPNHSSDEHPWFVESRASRSNPKRDWYIWRDAKPEGSLPSNWVSWFGGPAWAWDERTEQYYMHTFLTKQPDLNWRSPAVVEAMHDVLRFWLDRGVDGFRMDAVVFCAKHREFPDNPSAGPGSPFAMFGLGQVPVHNWNRPEVHEVIRGFRQVLDSYGGDRVMLGETAVFDPAELAKYYGDRLDEFHIPFNFLPLYLPWSAQAFKQTIQAYYAALPAGATPNFVLGNHDIHRLASRFGAANHRSAAMLLLTLWGVPTLYNGDELGMENVPIPPERVQDPIALRLPGSEMVGRDPERTPMQWDGSPNAGFAPAEVETWLPLAENYREVNVAAQRQDPSSTLSFYKRLLRLRRELPALHRGDFACVEGVPEEILAYTRSADGERVLALVNFGGEVHTLDVSQAGAAAELLLSTRFTEARDVDLRALRVQPNESLLLRIK